MKYQTVLVFDLGSMGRPDYTLPEEIVSVHHTVSSPCAWGWGLSERDSYRAAEFGDALDGFAETSRLDQD